MGMYRLASGELVDTSNVKLVSRAEDIDSSLVRLADERLVVFMWEADIGFAVASEAAAEDVLELYRHGELRPFYADDAS